MPNFNSPGIYIIEKDQSEYAPTVDSSVIGVVGFASRGPMNEATLVTSPQQLVQTFGRPDENIPGQGLIGAVEMLEATNKIVYVRAGDDLTALEASTVVPFGACPAVYVEACSIGVLNNGAFRVQVYNNAGVSQFDTPKLFEFASGTATTTTWGTSAQGIAVMNTVGQGSLDSAKVGAFLDSNANLYLVGAFAGSGATMAVSAYTDNTYTAGRTAFKALDASGNYGSLVSSVTVSGTTFVSPNAASGFGYLVKSLYPGTGYNLSSLSDGTVLGLSFEIDSLGGEKMLATVNDGGAANENYKVSLLAGVTEIEEVINIGTTNPTSDLIQGYLVSATSAGVPTDFDHTSFTRFADPLSSIGAVNILGKYSTIYSRVDGARFVKALEGTYSLANGTNGTGSTTANQSALIGDATVNPKTGMQALDDESLDISMACIPGFYAQSVQNALVTLAETSKKFLAVLSVPYGVGTAQDAIDWSNGLSESRTSPLNSSYAALYFPHVKVFSVFDGIDRDYDPVIFACRQMAYTDSNFETWFAPAGQVRGRLTKPTEVEVRLNQGDRDSLYGGGNIVNPIVSFPQQGIQIFGQRTTQRVPSALDRVNVRRMMIQIEKIILASTRQFIFEPNDPATWERVENLLNPLFTDIKNRRGITDFKVVCNESVNTPLRVDRNELWCKVLIKPTKTAEIIVFELNLVAQSASITQ